MHIFLDGLSKTIDKLIAASYRKEALRQAVLLNNKRQEEWDKILLDASHFLQFLELGE